MLKSDRRTGRVTGGTTMRRRPDRPPPLGWVVAAALLAALPSAPAIGQEQSVARDTLGGGRLALAPSDGTILRVERPAVTVLVADPEIADIQLVSDRTLFLFARTEGRTRVTLLDAEEELLGEVEVVVSGPLPSVLVGR